jgi:hypothetical protein
LQNVVGALFQVAKIGNDFIGCTDKTKAIFLFFQPYCVVRKSVSIKRLLLAGAVAMSNVSHAADWANERRADNVALPVEKRLIGWSFSLGVVLLFVLSLINHFFPVA